jgi:hypothetical protein
MNHVAGTALVVLSTMLLGFYALVRLVSSAAPIHANPAGLFVNAVVIAGSAVAVMAFGELSLQRKAAGQLKQDNEGFL